MPTITQAFAQNSPRLQRHSAPLPAIILLLMLGGVSIIAIGSPWFFPHLLAWSCGLLALAYDAGITLFVLRQSLRIAAPQAQASSEESLSTGIIVAAYNEAEVLPRTIRALLAQTSPAEIILIADDGSTDATPHLLSQHYGFAAAAPLGTLQRSPLFPQLAWLRLPHAGKAQTLNQAIRQVQTDLLITVDADTLLATDALAAMTNAFRHDQALVAATGVLTPVCPATASGRFWQWLQRAEYLRNFMARHAWMHAGSLLLISGAFSGFRRSALCAVGAFDPQCLVEDYEVIHRLYRYAAEHRLCWRTAVVGDARAQTSAPFTLKNFLQQRRRWFAGFLQTQYWNRDMIANRRYGNPGLLMLPVKTVDTLLPWQGMAAAITLPILLAGSSLQAPLLTLIGGKLLFDLLTNAWLVHSYRRWTGQKTACLPHLIATLLDPFGFQLLRQSAALLGWYTLLSGRHHWGKQLRHANPPKALEQATG